MQRLGSIFAVAGLSLAACAVGARETSESATQHETEQGDSGSEDASSPEWTADNCLDGQDMDAPDVDITRCPSLPAIPQAVALGGENVSLGAWEIGTTASGETYKYGSLEAGDAGETLLDYEGGSVAVNDGNLTCWAKGYYRLRRILQDPPREWLALRAAHFQFRFFQFQTDLRNGRTGYRRISSFQNHLVKWVTVVTEDGTCLQPTLGQFQSYAQSELTRRGLSLDVDGGVSDAGSP